jgi:hypothetical protein
MVVGSRMRDLLLKASRCFTDGYSPFNDEWLHENQVTLDECIDLSQVIGSVLCGFVLSDDETQLTVLIESAKPK